MRDFALYLKDIVKAIELIGGFVEGMDFSAFSKDEKTKSAVVRQLEVIGEASKKVPEAIRHEYPDVPWKKMAGMRDKLIHFYFGTDYATVWATIRDILPVLKPAIGQVIRQISPENNSDDS